MKKSALWWIGNSIIYGVPLLACIALFFDSRSGGYYLQITGILILVALIFIYKHIISQKVRDGKLASRIRRADGNPHWIWYLLSWLFNFALPLVILELLFIIFYKIGVRSTDYLNIVIGVGSIGYLLLIIDSARIKGMIK